VVWWPFDMVTGASVVGSAEKRKRVRRMEPGAAGAPKTFRYRGAEAKKKRGVWIERDWRVFSGWKLICPPCYIY
jgi:hypothetical protein